MQPIMFSIQINLSVNIQSKLTLNDSPNRENLMKIGEKKISLKSKRGPTAIHLSLHKVYDVFFVKVPGFYLVFPTSVFGVGISF